MYIRLIPVAAICAFGLLALAGCGNNLSPKQRDAAIKQCSKINDGNEATACCQKAFAGEDKKNQQADIAICADSIARRGTFEKTKNPKNWLDYNK